MPHHEPFQYYNTTANPNHLPPTSVGMIGQTDQANHQYDVSDFWEAADSGNMPSVSFIKAPAYQDGHAGYSSPLAEQTFVVETVNVHNSYGEQSCTAGRSSFITGQSVYRTGLSKVGLPGAPVGMNEKIVTIATLLKEQGYDSGQFGKNHLSDLNHMLPTNHGFDEFFGNLYHLDAEEEPEMDNYPSKKRFSQILLRHLALVV